MARISNGNMSHLPTTSPTLSQLSTVVPFVRHMESKGFSISTTLENFSISKELLTNTGVYVHSDVIYGLVNEFSQITDDVHLGVHVGECLDFSTWGPFRNAVENSTTLGDFLVHLIDSIPISSSAITYNLNVRAEKSELFVERQYQPVISTTHIDGFGVAFFTRLFESIVGVYWKPSAVTVHAKDISGIPNHYKTMTIKASTSSGVWIDFPTSWLTQKIELHSALDIARQINTPSDNTPVSVVVAFRALIEQQVANPDLSSSTAADIMGLSTRQLRASLTKNGTTSRKEIQSIRFEVAKKHLSESDRTISDIASMVGFAEPANFSRFFRKLAGKSPRQFRAENI